MRPRARSALQVGFQDAGPPFCGNLFEANLLATTVSQRHMATRCLRIAHPICVRPEHRDKIPFAVDDRHDQRQADGASGSPAAHLQCDQVIGSDPEHVDRGGASVGNAGQPIRAATTIEPSRQVHKQSIPDRALRQLTQSQRMKPILFPCSLDRGRKRIQGITRPALRLRP